MRRSGILFFILLFVQLVLYGIAKRPLSLTLFGNSLQALALLFAAIQLTRAARKAKNDEIQIKNLLAFGLWVWLMGHGLLSYSELLLKQAATGTVTDAIWLVGYMLIVRALYIRLRQLMPDGTNKLHLFLLLLISLVVCASLWLILIDPQRSVLIKFIQLVFPWMDLWIASMAYLIGKKSSDKRWNLAALGSTIIGIADLILPYFDTMNLAVYRYMDIPLFIGYSMWWLFGASLAADRSSFEIADS